MRTAFLRQLGNPFYRGPHISAALLSVFLGLNAIVAVNALLHDPRVGYDASDHIDYLRVLSHGKLPSTEDSGEFFAAPLPYAIPVLLRLVGVSRFGIIQKSAQLLNVLYSLLLTYYLIKICRIIRTDDVQLAVWALILLGMLTVYYRTLAFIRGEPLAAALAVVAVHQTLSVVRSDLYRRRQLLTLGILLGLVILAKQWGVLILGGVAVFMIVCALARTERRRADLQAVCLVLLLAASVGGWFYVYLHQRFGSSLAFNQPSARSLSLANRPREFYLGLGLDRLFTDPVRETFSQPIELFLPVFYSDVWGDYWCYWIVNGRDANSGVVLSGQAIFDSSSEVVTNRWSISRYLGRVNVAGVLPTMTYAGGAVLGVMAVLGFWKRRHQEDRGEAGLALCALSVGVSAAGYIFLLVKYPLLDVKASYMLQMFPFAAVLAAAFLCDLRARVPRAALVVQVLLLLSLLHNLPVLFTHYNVLANALR